MSDGRRDTREDAELALRLLPEVERFAQAVADLRMLRSCIDADTRRAEPLFPLHLVGKPVEDWTPEDEVQAADEAERWPASPIGRNVVKMASAECAAGEVMRETQKTTEAAARYFGKPLHPFRIPLWGKPDHAEAGAVLWTAAMELVHELRAASALLPRLEPAALPEPAPEAEEELPPLTPRDRLVLEALADHGPVLASVEAIRAEMPKAERVAAKATERSLRRLIDSGHVERPDGPKSGARVTRKGSRLVDLLRGRMKTGPGPQEGG